MSETFFRCDSPEDVQRVLRELIAAVPEEMAEGMWREGERIMNDSKRMTPVDTGYLRASGYVNDPTISSDGVEVELGHWANYAAPVHDRVNVQHETGTARFLEMALDEHVPGIGRRIVDRVMKRIGGQR